MTIGLTLLLAVAYLLMLTLLARRAEQKRTPRLRSSWSYALAMAVYCSAWTFYGSIGQVHEEGMLFLTTYIGPLALIPLWPFFLRKIIRISHQHRLANVAEFLSARYGNHTALGQAVALFTLIGIVPYIALQIQAIGRSFALLVQADSGSPDILQVINPAFALTACVALFVLIFGTRRVESFGTKDGLLAAVRAESLIKLIIFLAVGGGILLMNGPEVASVMQEVRLAPVSGSAALPAHWLGLSLLSGLAFFMLPRQFHVAVVENRTEHQLEGASWRFALYLVLITLLVLPIGLLGGHVFPDASADGHFIHLASHSGVNLMGAFVFLGGFSAAIGMMTVSVLALSNMTANSLIIPTFVSPGYVPSGKEKPSLRRLGILWLRRMVVVAIFALAYGFYHAFRGEATLVSTGLVSFVAMAQFAPPMIGALFWRDGRPGPALAGIVSGGVLWFILLMLPFYLSAAGDAQIFAEGYFGIGWLHPYRLFDVGGMPPILHATFWSLFVNIVVFIGGSLLKRPSAEVERQAELFINVFAYGDRLEETYRWRGEAQVSTLKALLRRYLGKAETERLIGAFMARHDISVSDSDKADPRLVTFVETELSSILGPAAARLLVASVVKEQRSTRRDVLRMIQQTQQYLSDNQALQRQSRELEAAAREIQRSHEKLEKLSSVKDDFISTVTHELRTPLTSIKAYVEFLSEEDLSEDQRAQFLATLTRETDRMARLINQVLELERLADDEGAVDMRSCQMLQILERAATAMRPMFEEREAMLIIDAPDELPPLNGDADALHQVLLNLLSNALKHLPAEGGKVVLSAFYLDGGITLSVRDNGPGIPAEFRETIFDRFVQVREAPQRKPAGSGLGLAISRRIVQRHRGQIWLENPPGGGAKFVLFVPLNRPVDPDSKPAAFQ